MILTNPDCRDGKHGNCTGGLDDLTGEPAQCPCHCHPDPICNGNPCTCGAKEPLGESLAGMPDGWQPTDHD